MTVRWRPAGRRLPASAPSLWSLVIAAVVVLSVAAIRAGADEDPAVVAAPAVAATPAPVPVASPTAAEQALAALQRQKEAAAAAAAAGADQAARAKAAAEQQLQQQQRIAALEAMRKDQAQRSQQQVNEAMLHGNLPTPAERQIPPVQPPAPAAPPAQQPPAPAPIRGLEPLLRPPIPGHERPPPEPPITVDVPPHTPQPPTPQRLSGPMSSTPLVQLDPNPPATLHPPTPTPAEMAARSAEVLAQVKQRSEQLQQLPGHQLNTHAGHNHAAPPAAPVANGVRNQPPPLTRQPAIRRGEIVRGHNHGHGGEHDHAPGAGGIGAPGDDVTDNNHIHIITVNHSDHTHIHLHTHGGSLSGRIVLTLFGILIASQAVIYGWRKYHAASYQAVTLAALWLVPAVWSYTLDYYRFIAIWACVSAYTAYVIVLASRSPVARTTPRRIYGWFFLNYRVCYGLAAIGYGIFLSTFFGVPLLLHMPTLPATGMLFGFYGLYFGLLSRDCAEMCASRLAQTLGYTASKDGFPKRHLAEGVCAICDGPLRSAQRERELREREREVRARENDGDANNAAFLRSQQQQQNASGAVADERVYTLTCRHVFHDYCIRGWTLIGKRDTCPHCSEKVQLKEIFTNPWERTSQLWAMLLDALRYLIVFNPAIMFTMQYALVHLFAFQETPGSPAAIASTSASHGHAHTH